MSDPVKVPSEVFDQLNTVRETGRTNMGDPGGIQIVANDLGLYALVLWVEDNRGTGKLGLGVLVGFEPAEETA